MEIMKRRRINESFFWSITKEWNLELFFGILENIFYFFGIYFEL